MMHGRLKKIIFDKLYKDLSKLEIIDYRNSIWFIDRENKYWYLEYDKDGRLYWRYDFFPNFFSLFSFERDEFEPILAEWVEEVLNHKVDATFKQSAIGYPGVEEILNHKVDTILPAGLRGLSMTQDVLNCKVDSIIGSRPWWVQDVLNCKVNTIYHGLWHQAMAVENVLNCKINKTISLNHPDYPNVEDALNCNVVKT
jgi:hypothetical protein